MWDITSLATHKVTYAKILIKFTRCNLFLSFSVDREWNERWTVDVHTIKNRDHYSCSLKSDCHFIARTAQKSDPPLHLTEGLRFKKKKKTRKEDNAMLNGIYRKPGASYSPSAFLFSNRLRGRRVLYYACNNNWINDVIMYKLPLCELRSLGLWSSASALSASPLSSLSL